jgi:hypothetical protein
MSIGARNTDPQTSKDAAVPTRKRDSMAIVLLRQYDLAGASGLDAYDAAIKAGFIAGHEPDGRPIAKDSARRRTSDLHTSASYRKLGGIEPLIAVIGAHKGNNTDAKEREVWAITGEGRRVLRLKETS